MRGKCKIEGGKNYHDDNPRVAAHCAVRSVKTLKWYEYENMIQVGW